MDLEEQHNDVKEEREKHPWRQSVYYDYETYLRRKSMGRERQLFFQYVQRYLPKRTDIHEQSFQR